MADMLPKALRERIAAAAGHRCGYCQTAVERKPDWWGDTVYRWFQISALELGLGTPAS
jgi:hypothetical protein